MSSTARFVTTRLTQATPVSGSEHVGRSLEAPARLVCIIATTMLSAEATRSIAPPIPFTIFPGIFQLAMSPVEETSIAPRTVS